MSRGSFNSRLPPDSKVEHLGRCPPPLPPSSVKCPSRPLAASPPESLVPPWRSCESRLLFWKWVLRLLCASHTLSPCHLPLFHVLPCASGET